MALKQKKLNQIEPQEPLTKSEIEFKKQKMEESVNNLYDKYIMAEAKHSDIAPVYKMFVEIFFKMKQMTDTLTDMAEIFTVFDDLMDFGDTTLNSIMDIVTNSINNNPALSRMKVKYKMWQFRKGIKKRLSNVQFYLEAMGKMSGDFSKTFASVDKSLKGFGTKKGKKGEDTNNGAEFSDNALNELIQQRRKDLAASGDINPSTPATGASTSAPASSSGSSSSSSGKSGGGHDYDIEGEI